MRNSILALCAFLGVAFISPSFAGGSDFAGPYAGLFAAHGRDKSPTWSWPVNNSLDADDLTGWMGGLQAGYNWSSNDWVYGVEADAAFGSLTSSTECSNPSWDCDIKVDRTYSLRGRLGRAFGNTLLYLTAGYGAARIEASTIEVGVGPRYSDRETQHGWAYGLGVAHKFGTNTSAWLDVVHYNLGAHEYQTDVPYDVEVEPTLIRAGFNYQF